MLRPIKCSTLKSTTDRPVLYLVIATGISSVVTQLFLLREYLSQFQGNEIVIALVLFNWLILGGLGTRLAHGSHHPSTHVLSILSLVLVVLAVAQVILIRWLRVHVFTTGVSVGFYPILAFTALTMAPYALLIGYVLPYSLYVIRNQHAAFPGVWIYMADNLGDVGGGALFAFVLIQWASPMQSLVGANLPLVVAALCVSKLRWYRIAAAIAVAAIMLLGLAAENRTLVPRIGKLLDYRESRFARLTVHQDQEQTTVFTDGRPMCSTQNTALAEELVHYPLSQLNQPKRILLISAVGGIMAELVKYHPDRVDYVELDPLVTQLLLKYKLVVPIKALHPIYADARKWLRLSTLTYHAILINLPEPDTFQLNRFYTDEFFAMAKAHLAADGILCFAIQGYANYITGAQKEKCASLRKTAGRHFKHVAMLPGERVVFLCRQSPLDLDIPGRLASLGIATKYVGPYFHGNVTPQRIRDLKAGMNLKTPINSDTRPYVMQTVFQQWFVKFGTSPRVFMAVVAALIGLYLMRLKREAFVLFTTGWTSMGSEVLVIFAFQIFLGYIYVEMGLVVTVFLAGLLPGAWLGQKAVKHSLALLLVSDGILVLLLLLTVLSLHFSGAQLPPLFYYGSGLVISLMCGFQFPLALAQMGDSNITVTRILSVDLVGAACGTLVTSTVLIPYLGLGGAFCALMGIKMLSLLILGEKYAFRRSTRFSNS